MLSFQAAIHSRT